mgnify:CR=1 FL=1
MPERSRAAEAELDDVSEGDHPENQRFGMVKIGDREVSQEELVATYQLKDSWQASITQQQQGIAEIVKGMTAAAQAARSAPRREEEAERPAPRAEVVDLESEIDTLTSGLPDPAEHPAEFKAGFNAGLKKLFPRYRQSVVEEVVNQVEAKQARQAQQLREETKSAVQGSAESQAVVNQNVRLLDETLDEMFPGHTTAQRVAVAEELKALRGNTKYGEVIQCADGNSVVRYTRSAVLQAAKMADVKPSSRTRPSQQQQNQAPEELGAPPASTAPAKSHINWLRQAAVAGGEEARAAQEYFENLPPKKRNEIHEAYRSG